MTKIVTISSFAIDLAFGIAAALLYVAHGASL